MIYSFLCFMLPNIVWQIVNKNRIKNKQYIVLHMIWTYVFMLYCYLACEVAADMGTIWDILKYKRIMGQVYLRPFIVDELTSHVLNIIMFMPLGFLLPLIWSNFRDVFRVALLGFCMSFAIEVSQLFCYRTTDINDLFTNALGTIIGYILWIIFHKIWAKSGNHCISMSKVEPVIYIFGGMLGIFFLYIK